MNWKTAYTQLESEKTQIESEKNQLESENADLKAQIGPLGIYRGRDRTVHRDSRDTVYRQCDSSDRSARKL